ncbi:MAG: hypothetical protein HUJ31_08945, partial [Pseudomonadales bacterium]|nr:hypothetical protein [Pseudomonadales bacterium]
MPDKGIQPRMAIDSGEEVHLIYFKPITSNSGNLVYRKLDQSSGSWSDPVQVSSEPYRHLGAISKASIAVDGNGRIHVSWLALNPFAYRYTRSNTAGTEFEKERLVVREHLEGVDAEAALAARDNHVTLAWHAGELIKEDSRVVYAMTSTDGGGTFGQELVISDTTLGACACCGLASLYTDDDRFFVAYRSAIDGKGRHMQLIATDPTDSPPTPTTREVSQWFLETCPVSSNNFALIAAGASPWLAFETRGEILLTTA